MLNLYLLSLILKTGFGKFCNSELCTFNTRFGRYKTERLPFGISCAPEIFHKKTAEMFADIPGVEIGSHDYIESGVNEAEHLAKINSSKLQYQTAEVTFVGHTISVNGIKLDPKKVEATLSFATPQNKKDLTRLLGLAQTFF